MFRFTAVHVNIDNKLESRSLRRIRFQRHLIVCLMILTHSVTDEKISSHCRYNVSLELPAACTRTHTHTHTQ